MNDDPLIGRQLGNFMIERILGRGGMAQVYYGHDVKLQRPVAIKVIDARYRSKPGYAQRFVKEARAVARLRHENIIQIYYADDQDDLYYYAMEYIDGEDLATLMSSYITEGDFMPPEDVLIIGRAIAAALDFAHKKGLIHRDVKPSNVLLSKDDRVVLSDFGLALDMQEGSSGEAFGTPHYISPEQARRSKDVVPQSDLYALGVILYEMLTGVVPFDDVSPTSVALQHITQPPPPPRSINPQLNIETEAVLLKALSKTPQERYQSGKELLDALETALLVQRETQEAEKVPPLPPIPAAILSNQAPTVFQNPIENEAAAAETQLQAPKASTLQPAQATSALPEREAKKASGPWLAVALLGLTVFLLVGGSFFLPPGSYEAAISFVSTQTGFNLPGAVADANTPEPTPPASETPLSTPVRGAENPTASATVEVPTSTAEAAQVLTHTPTPLLAMTETATAAPTPSPAGTAAGAPDAPSITPDATLPVKYPNGKRFQVFYDANGLYLVNASDENRPLEPFAFERLDDAGTAHNLFEGWRWSQFFPTIYAQNCVKIEIINSPEYAARPPQCENRYVSEAARFYERNSPFVFWTAQDGSQFFRVRWEDEEVARCEIARGACEVFVP